LERLQWNTNQLVALATNGATLVIGCHHGLTSHLRYYVPALVNTHCTAHQEALVNTHCTAHQEALVNTHCSAHQEALFACDEFKTIPKLLILDQFTIKVYEWVARSSN
jgi:hypothetical protein